MSKIELDRQSFEALASETRVAILKELDHGQRTLAQLSETFAADKAGLHRHLEKLVEGGLVQREESRKWVYYSLTWKGKRLVNPDETTRVVLLLSAAAPLLTVGMILLVALATPGTIPGIPRGELDWGAAPSQDALYGEQVQTGFLELVSGASLIVLGAVLLLFGLLRWHRWSAVAEGSTASDSEPTSSPPS